MIILDIDNCISNDEWRIGCIEWDAHGFARYHRYHSLAPWDECMQSRLFRGKDCAVITARPEFYRHITFEWLRRAGVTILHLLMRGNEDHRPSVEVKRDRLQPLLRWKKEIEAAYDDNPAIVEMYRAHGINAEVRALHDHPYKPS